MKLSTVQKGVLCALAGAFIGLGLLSVYLLRFHTYLGDDPSACVNCHIMSPYYNTWMHSSHARNATCNDCHVPHQNMVRKYAFKGMDGMKHVGMFLTYSERQVPMAQRGSDKVIMDNCVRCHTELNTEVVKTGKISYMQTLAGEGKACWDCHRNGPHGRGNSLSTVPGGITPFPDAAAPQWLRKAVGYKGNK